MAPLHHPGCIDGLRSLELAAIPRAGMSEPAQRVLRSGVLPHVLWEHRVQSEDSLVGAN